MNKVYKVYWSDGTTEDYTCNMFNEIVNKLFESEYRIIEKIELTANVYAKSEVSN